MNGTLEDEIGKMARTSVVKPMVQIDFAAPSTQPDLGRLTAEALLSQYEHAAKSIETMGDTVKESVAKLEAAMKDHAADLKLIADAANHIREKGKAASQQIESAVALTKDVREACAQFTKK